MRFLSISLSLTLLFIILLTCSNQQASAHYDVPSDGTPYHVTVILKEIEFRDGASSKWEDITSGADIVIGWRVEYIGHDVYAANTVVLDNYNIVDGRRRTLDIPILEHDECSPLSSMRLYTWGVESEQNDILTSDELMKQIIQNPNLSTGHADAQRRFGSIGDEFLGHQSRLVNLQSGKSGSSSGNADRHLPVDEDNLIRALFEITLTSDVTGNTCNFSTQTASSHDSKTAIMVDRQGTSLAQQDKTTGSENKNKVAVGQKIKPELVKNAKTPSISVDTQIKISNNDLKTLYKIAKLHESAATSLSSVNDQQKIILQKATASANKVLTKDQKDKLKPLLKEQDSDKKDIKAIQDYAKKVSNTIKKLAQKEGLKPSDLDKIAKPVKDGKPSKKGPVDQLKQDATNAKNNLDDAKKFQEELDLQKIAHQIGDILPDSEGRGDFEKRMEKRFEEQQARERDRQDREREQKLAKQQEEADEKSKQHVIDMMQQLLELVQKQEQAQTGSILDTISEPTLKDLFVQTSPTQDTKPVAKKDPSKPITATNFISVQSKRGTYGEPTNPCSTKNVTIEATWVLAKSSNIDSGSVTVLQLDLNKPNGPTSKQREIKDGVIQYSDYAQHPGRYQVWLAINGKVVQDGLIDITIPNLCTNTSPPVIAEPGGGGFTTSDTKPILTIPKQITQEATGPSGASVDYVPIGFDKEDGSITPVCNPPPYSIFPIGTTTVSCTVTDSAGNSISGSFTVTIRDTTPPNIPAFQPREGVKDESGIQVFYEVTATDIVDGAVQVSCNYPSGYKFPIGVTVLTCTAMDSHGNPASRSLQITVTSTQSGQ